MSQEGKQERKLVTRRGGSGWNQLSRFFFRLSVFRQGQFSNWWRPLVVGHNERGRGYD